MEYNLDNASTADVAAASSVATAYIIFAIIYYVLTIVAMWKIFAKAGEPGWAAIIPFYNYYVLFKITWGQGLMFLLLLIPCVNIVIAILTSVKLGKAFGKSGAFIAGLIFLSFIFELILAFDNSEYLGVPKSN